MTKPTHWILTCTKNHTWEEPIPINKVAAGEHRLCPMCGGSSWITPDVPTITKIKTILGEHTLKSEKQVPRKPRPGIVNIITEEKAKPNITPSQEFVSNVTSSDGEDVSVIGRPSPDSISQTKKIPIPKDLIPTRELLNEDAD